MASKKPDSPEQGRTARGGEPRGTRQHTASRAGKPPPDGTGTAARGPAQEAPAAPDGAIHPSPGLDAARHAAAQKAAHGAEVLRQAYVPASLATALGMGTHFDGSACRVYLDRFVHDAGDPRDPVERVLLEQVAIAHLRLADLHSQAAQAKSTEAVKVYTSATARLLGEVCRLGLALREYKGHVPRQGKLRIAQVG